MLTFVVCVKLQIVDLYSRKMRELEVELKNTKYNSLLEENQVSK